MKMTLMKIAKTNKMKLWKWIKISNQYLIVANSQTLKWISLEIMMIQNLVITYNKVKEIKRNQKRRNTPNLELLPIKTQKTNKFLLNFLLEHRLKSCFR